MTLATDIFNAPATDRPRSAAPALCAHCNQPVPRGLIVADPENQFCCAGCRAVYETLHSCGLDSYYRLRDAAQSSAQPANPTCGTFESFDSPTFHRLYVHGHAAALSSSPGVSEKGQGQGCVEQETEAQISLKAVKVTSTFSKRWMSPLQLSADISPAPGTPGKGWGGGSRERQSLDTPSLPLPRSTGGGNEGGQQSVARAGARVLTTDLALEGVSCAACVWLLERLPRVLEGVIEARLSLREATVRITWDPQRLPLSRIAMTLDRLGYTPHPARGQSSRSRHQHESRRRLMHLGVAGAIMGNTMLLAFALYAGERGTMDPRFHLFFRWLSALLGAIALAWPGATFFRSAWAAIRLRSINLDVPIALALAVGGAAGLINVALNRGEIYFDSLTVLVFLLLVGRFIQYRQQRWADDAVGLLFNLTPSSCRILRDGMVIEAPIESLRVGDLVEVRAGDLFPADGIVETGRSSVNEALLTGESTPSTISPGTPVHAGSQNIGGIVRVRVEKVGVQTRVGQLMHLIERGTQEKPAIVQFADKVGAWFVAVVTFAAAGVFAFWSRRAGLSPAINHAVALLIVTCPCVLGLATPLTLAIAIGKLARRDILVKSGKALERLSRGGAIILDKTGTLTEGRLQLLEWVGDESLRPVVARIEQNSNHPVGRALSRALRHESDEDATVTGVIEAGHGGVGAIVDGHAVHIGSLSFAARHGVCVNQSLRHAVAVAAAAGATPVVIALDSVAVAAASLGDSLRAESKSAITRLRQLGWEPSIQSGDADAVVQNIAQRLDIDPTRAQGRQSPEDKLDSVRRLQDVAPVVMVGDGVNDAAALAAADVGIAVQGGAEASLAAADVYIARPGLDGLVELIEMSRRAMRTIHRNLAISLMYNLLAGIIAAAGMMSPLCAAIIMPVSSATVLTFAVFSLRRASKGPSPVPISSPLVAIASEGGR